jgi:hypothetical protein
MVVEFRRRRQHAHSEDVRDEHEYARAYLNFQDDSRINWVMIRAFRRQQRMLRLFRQDGQGLGSTARMKSLRESQRKLEMALSSRA